MVEGTEADLHICISHWRRRKIGLEKQIKAAEGKACIQIPSGEDPSYPCFVGTRLVGNATNGKIVNGGRYEVVGINNGITLEDHSTGVHFEVNLETLSKNCILAWALTYPKVQGITETGTVILHDLGSKHFKKCHLYVGLSRVTDGKHIFVSAA